MALEEDRDLVFVLLRFEAARAVDETSSGPDHGGDGVEQGGLEGGGTGERFGIEAPTGLDTAAQHACVGAGRVEQGGVHRRHVREGLQICPIDSNTLDGGHAPAAEVFLQAGQTRGEVAGEDAGGSPGVTAAFPEGEFREVAGFPSGRGTCIEDGFAGLGIEKLGGERGPGVLHGDTSFGEPFSGEMFVGVMKSGMPGHGLDAGSGAGGAGANKWVEPEGEAGGLGGGAGEKDGLFLPVVLFPMLPQGIGEVVADGRRRGGGPLVEDFRFAGGAAEHRIGEAAGSVRGDAHDAINGGMRGHSGIAELRETESQQIAGGGIQFPRAGFFPVRCGEVIDPPV